MYKYIKKFKYGKTAGLLMALCLILTCAGAFAQTAVYFSPKGGCQDVVKKEAAKASKKIDVAMYYFTSREIAQEIVKAKDRNVKIRVLLDVSQEALAYSKSRYLANKGIDVRYHAGKGLMHNKFAVIDDKTLITGSMNWTPTADRSNEENLLVMSDKGLVKKYSKRFEELWSKARMAEVSDTQEDEE